MPVGGRVGVPCYFDESVTYPYWRNQHNSSVQFIGVIAPAGTYSTTIATRSRPLNHETQRNELAELPCVGYERLPESSETKASPRRTRNLSFFKMKGPHNKSVRTCTIEAKTT